LSGAAILQEKMTVLKTHQSHIAVLDGLRGVAAAAVVWFHMTVQTYGVSTPFRGYLAVDFFFILSGFVIARAYESRLLTNMSLQQFLRARIIRLYPLVALAILLGAASKLLSSHHGNIPAAMFFGLLLLPYSWAGRDFGTGNFIFPLDPPLWSLMFEVWVNVFYAVAARQGPRVLRVATLCSLCLGTAGIIYCGWMLGGFPPGNQTATLWIGVVRVLCAFFFGVALHHILVDSRVALLPSVPFPILSLAFLAILFAGPQFGGLYDVVAVIFIFPIFVALGVKDCAGKAWRKVALFSGAVSYPVYVLHIPTLAHFTHFRGHSLPLTLATMTVAFVMILGLSYLVLRIYDEPTRGWLNRSLRGRTSQLGATASPPCS
jgi:peptidoglycan/LPS O-acetylase OafA/YrhL